MFSSQIVVTLSNGNDILLPKEFRIVPIYYETTGYIPSYTVEGENYGGYFDYDEGIIYEEEEDKIYEYISKIYGDIDSYEIKYKIDLNEFTIALDFFDNKGIIEFIDELIAEYKLSDESIDIILHNKDFLNEYIKNPFISCAKTIDELNNKTVIINLSEIDNLFIGVGMEEYNE